MAGERILGRAALRHDPAIELLDRDSPRREHRALVGGAIGQDRGPFLVQPHRHPSRGRVLQQTFQGEEAAAGDDARLDFLVTPPAIHSAMRVDDLGQKCAHPGPPFAIGSAMKNVTAAP
ncbi:MAG: hypothetical protein WDM81_06475 [Rhizomicrobium sp.]